MWSPGEEGRKVYEDGMIHHIKCCSDIKSNEVQELTVVFSNVESPDDLDRSNFTGVVGWMG